MGNNLFSIKKFYIYSSSISFFSHLISLLLFFFKRNTIYPVARKFLARVTEEPLHCVITSDTANKITSRKVRVKTFSSFHQVVCLSYCYKLIGTSAVKLRGRIYSLANYLYYSTGIHRHTGLIYHSNSPLHKANTPGSIF